ncbi:sensor histidine kinase [Nonomuraea sp. NPDC050556]|uniref:sensor histidine kinase n=1 Tax=Nonomuraea sp. NPDC050556 TaxID=3364369 RepID=UPI0037AB716D
MKRRSLRSRLTLLVTVAVALAIAICLGASFFIVNKALNDEVNRRVMPPPGRSQDPYELEDFLSNCKRRPAPINWHGPAPEMSQIIYADGQPTCYNATAITITANDLAIAAKGGSSLHNGTAPDGTALRVYTANVGPGMAIMNGARIDGMQGALRKLALLLVGVAGVGVFGAAWAGRAISRTVLRPVERLTGAVEHIAQTEDLDTTIPVEGDDEIARLSTSFNSMTTALAGSRDRQRQLVADAGHELRTPLTTLRTNIDLLLRSEQQGRALEPGAKERLLVNVKAQFAELSTLVGDLLQLSRGETDHEPHIELAFHDVVQSAIERARLRGAEVEASLDPWFTVGNPASLERAVVNLLDNAAKFSPGAIEVTLANGTLTVRDHGPGIPEDELPHVFERFWRSPSARPLPGSGLGLAIVAQAVEVAGGAVRLENAPGGGVVVTLTLPGSAVLSSR